MRDPSRAGRVLFVGDVNVDLVFSDLASAPIADREIPCASFAKTVGSTAVITACNYAQLGGDAGVCGLCGVDEWGDYMVEEMVTRRVDTTLVSRSAEVATGITVNLIHGNDRTQVTYPGAIAVFTGELLFEGDNLARWGHVHFSGVFQQTAFLPHLARALTEAKRHGLTTSLDTQWDYSERWEGIDEWGPNVDVLFVNRDEAASITGVSDPGAALDRLTKRFALVVVKLGEDGVIVGEGSRRVSVPAIPVPVVDTTGAGDAFASGFLNSYLRDPGDIQSAGEAGALMASYICTHAGGVAKEPTTDSYERFLKRSRRREGDA